MEVCYLEPDNQDIHFAHFGVQETTMGVRI